jgi:hypothetical protein
MNVVSRLPASAEAVENIISRKYAEQNKRRNLIVIKKLRR